MAKKEYSLAHTKWMYKYHIVFTPKISVSLFMGYLKGKSALMIGGVVMNRMEEEGYSVYRDELNIIVETNENKKFVFPLKKQNIVTGKINIPLSNLCTMNCLYCSEAEYNRKKAKRFDINVAYQIIDAYMKWLDDYPSVNQVRLSFD